MCVHVYMYVSIHVHHVECTLVCILQMFLGTSVVPAQLRAFVGDSAKARDLGFVAAGGGCE